MRKENSLDRVRALDFATRFALSDATNSDQILVVADKYLRFLMAGFDDEELSPLQKREDRK